MKSLLISIVISAFVFGSADARTLEDILKEKGVITEDDYREVTRELPVSYKPGEGFTFATSDHKHKGSVGGMLQVRYTLTDFDNINDTPAKRAEDSSKFELRRIKVYFNGYAFTEDLSYKLTLNFANFQGGTTINGGALEDTYLDYRLLDQIRFRFGQDKVPFSRQFLVPTSSLQFPDISVVTTAFVPGYDTGVMIHGTFGNSLLTYKIGGYGGVGQNTLRSTRDNAFAVRLTSEPLGEMKNTEADVDQSPKPLISIGANYFRDTLNPGNTLGRENNFLYFGKATGWYGIGRPTMLTGFDSGEAVDFDILGLDAAVKWMGLSLQGEWFLAQGAGQVSGVVLRGQGWYVQGGAFLIPSHLELAGRYSYLDPNRNATNDHWVEATGGISWYFDKHNLKLQTDYTVIHKQRAIALNTGPANTDDQQVRVQAQVLF